MINPEIFQEFLDSASNAHAVGQAQYFTPVQLARTLAGALPAGRHALVDFTCGNGQLLEGCSKDSTEHFLGSEIDPAALRSAKIPKANLAKADFTQLAPLLHAAQFQADLILLNPPWNLHWPTDQFTFLDSSLSSPRPQRLGGESTLDSTFATYLSALHFLTPSGEGLLIANHSTVQRLILPSPAAAHIWAHIIIEGNPCTASGRNKFQAETKTSVLYFARSHQDGPVYTAQCSEQDLPAAVSRVERSRIDAGRLYQLSSNSGFHPETAATWNACTEELHRRLTATSAAGRPRFNLWIHPSSGTIQTHLSLFDQKASPELAAQASTLHELQGKSPYTLVMQRGTRDLLLHAAQVKPAPVHPVPSSSVSSAPLWLKEPSPWLVDPKLQQAIRTALAAYHRQRAPLYSLPEIQRLGYLEEEDTITCKQSLHSLFIAGQSYPLETRSASITRSGHRTNWKGDEVSLEYTGQELITLITAEDGQQYPFLDSRILHQQDVRIHDPLFEDSEAGRQQCSRSRDNPARRSPNRTAFDLQTLVTHFEIPEVPDVATLHPEQFNHNLATLTQLESLLP